MQPPQALIDALGCDAVVSDAADLSVWQTGWRGERGRAGFVLRPATTEQVSKAVAYCVAAGIPLVPQSGNTGLVGGSTPDASGSQAVLSLERLRGADAVVVDATNRSVRVGAGVRLSELNEHLAHVDLYFPIDLGADPMIGGMVATNTGGARFLRYGDVRAHVLGLTIVLPDRDGTVLQLGGALRKDNTGPDWKQLFIGTGGAFGIVTEAVLNVEPVPQQRATALVVPRSESAIPGLLYELESRLAGDLSAFEFMSGNAMRHALAHAPAVRDPFRGERPALALLVETARAEPPATAGPSLTDALERTLGAIWEHTNDPLVDALFGPPAELWPLRHALSEGVRQAGPLFAFDLAFPRADVFAFRASMSAQLAAHWPELELCDFGHVGDGGIHFNLVCHDPERAGDAGYEAALRDAVIRHAVEDFGGSFSGEHGIGRTNQRYYDRYTSTAEKRLADGFREALRLAPNGALRFGCEG